MHYYTSRRELTNNADHLAWFKFIRFSFQVRVIDTDISWKNYTPGIINSDFNFCFYSAIDFIYSHYYCNQLIRLFGLQMWRKILSW